MGKPYGHEYHFEGGGTQKGTMICAHCNQPIFPHSQDWMVYQRTCKDEYGWPDWKYVCFHRKCCTDQSGWEKIEESKEKEKTSNELKMQILRDAAKKIGVDDPVDFADLAAASLGMDDLDNYFFGLYGSC